MDVQRFLFFMINQWSVLRGVDYDRATKKPLYEAAFSLVAEGGIEPPTFRL